VTTSRRVSRRCRRAGGQCAEVDVGAGGHARGRERLALRALLHEQRRPRVDDAGVLAVLDAGEQRLVLERLVALLEERDILLAAHERHVRGRVDERRRGIQHALSSTRDDQNWRLCWNCSLIAIALAGRPCRPALGRVVQLAQRRVAVPALFQALELSSADVVEPLVDDDLPVGLQLRRGGCPGSHS
jgi:hypothetical protein